MQYKEKRRHGLSQKMRNSLLSALALLSTLNFPVHAEDGMLLRSSAKVISQPDLKGPLGSEWSTGKGRWEPGSGLLKVTDLPEEHHIPVLHLATGPVPLVWECQFRFNSGKAFLVGCDGQKHVGRVVIGPKVFKICEDSTEVKGKSPSHTLTEAAVGLQSGDWHTLRVESRGEQMAARLDGVELLAEHAYLGSQKVRWWFAAGDSVEIRNVRVSEGEPLQAKAAPAP